MHERSPTHQSGGLGVASSNLAAPTNLFNDLCHDAPACLDAFVSLVSRDTRCRSHVFRRRLHDQWYRSVDTGPIDFLSG